MLAVMIDDEPAVLETFQLLLEMMGFEVIAAASADEALAGLGRNDTTPDIIISDYRLANNLLGTDAIHSIQDFLGTPVPGMIITGDTSPKRIEELQNNGFRLIHKPVRAQELKKEIFDFLGGAS